MHIFFTTDIHGNYFSYDFRYRHEGEGSLERVCGFIEEQRKRYGSNDVVLIDGGDIIQGGPEAYYFNHLVHESNHVVGDMCRFMGYDAGVVGNHDIESGKDAMKRFQSCCGYPLLAANIKDKDGNLVFQPYTVIERGGRRIAVVGFCSPATKRWLPADLCDNMYFDDIVESAHEWSERIRKAESPDLLIALMHSGWQGGIQGEQWKENCAREVAENTSGYDIILFGHDHFSKIQTASNAEDHDVACLNAGCYGYFVAEAEVTFSPSGKTIESRLHDMRHFAFPSPSPFLKQFKDAFQKIEHYSTTIIGHLSSRLDISKAYLGSSAYMSMIHRLQLEVSGADISLASPYYMESVIDKGPFTIADLYTIYWFEDRLYTIHMSGKEIKNLLERSYGLWTKRIEKADEPFLDTLTDKESGKTYFRNLIYCFDTAAGIDYEVDVSKGKGEKVNILRMSDGRPFSADKTYKVATIGHRANGGGKMLTSGAGIAEKDLADRVVGYTPYDIRHYLKGYFEKSQETIIKETNNWRFILPNQ